KLPAADGLLSTDGWLTIPMNNDRELILQWGIVKVDYSKEHSAYAVPGGSVNRHTGEGSFPVAFPNNLLFINAAGNDVLNTYIASVYSASLKSFKWAYHSTSAYVASGGGSNTISWLAIGN
ncbi:gp53-like domain-containing protein, partial [Enterobacter hormaechei]